MESRITPLLTLSALKASNANDQTLESKPESQQTTQQQLIGYPSLTDSFTKGSRKPGTSSTRLGEASPISQTQSFHQRFAERRKCWEASERARKTSSRIRTAN